MNPLQYAITQMFPAHIGHIVPGIRFVDDRTLWSWSEPSSSLWAGVALALGATVTLWSHPTAAHSPDSTKKSHQLWGTAGQTLLMPEQTFFFRSLEVCTTWQRIMVDLHQNQNRWFFGKVECIGNYWSSLACHGPIHGNYLCLFVCLREWAVRQYSCSLLHEMQGMTYYTLMHSEFKAYAW